MTKIALVTLTMGLIFLQSTSLVSNAQETRTARTKTLSGGILNRRAAEKPLPTYPLAARTARVSGTVVVQVIVDESGKVQTAKAISGHPLLREAAVDAAYQARFAPTRVKGDPVKVSGVLVYNFLRTSRRLI